MRAADGTPLKTALSPRAAAREDQSHGRRCATVSFIVLSFIAPILMMLYNSVLRSRCGLKTCPPRWWQLLQQWDGKDIP